MNLKDKSIDELNKICKDIRERILEVTSKNGGHLGSSLGAVELIVAMHYVFDVTKDPFIFDVSHQSYAHKLLTSRWNEFENIRKFNGLSGYTKPSESEFDYFIAGHSSTSISLLVGAAKAIKLKKENRIPIALIGDGAMSGGMVYEAMDELGARGYKGVIILNDNNMSISKPIGALSNFLSQTLAGKGYQKFKSKVNKLLSHTPDGFAYFVKRFEDSFRLLTQGMIFEEFGIEYIGPIDGHNLNEIINALNIAKSMSKPVIIHAQTKKGKGYKFSEENTEKFHGVSKFDIETGQSLNSKKVKTATEIFSTTLDEIASKNKNVVGVTAAMPSGTGLDRLIKKYPDRFWDVAIAEQHAVTSMAAMAKEGFKPFITIYSTFLQRGYDQVIHDCAIMNLNVVFAMDRSGIVGEDGETHAGVFDISYLNAIPNISLIAPRDEESFKNILNYSLNHTGPLAIRYPRGEFGLKDEFKSSKIEFKKFEILINNSSNISLIGYGDGVGSAYKTLKELDFKVNLIDLVFAKPLDKDGLIKLSKFSKIWFIFSKSAKKGGIGDILSSFLQENNIFDVKIHSFEIEDKFLVHGKISEVEEYINIDSKSCAKEILRIKNIF